MLTVIDLFSGIGSFSLGLEKTGGFKTIAFCENDSFCRKVLNKHWPQVPILNDVKTAEFPQADVIVGGFPCQDVSRAGKRAGLSGARSGLYRELVRAIRLVRPRYAIVENVADLLADGMGVVLGDLAEGGDCQWIEWDCVPAQALGAPHKRDRVWIVAHAKGLHDGPRDRKQAKRQESESGSDISAPVASYAESNGCGEGWPGRPPDSFARIRDTTRGNAPDTHCEQYQEREDQCRDAEQEQPTAARSPFENVWQQGWTREPALLGMDDGVADRVDRTKALGNTLLPQIPELIGLAILDAETA